MKLKTGEGGTPRTSSLAVGRKGKSNKSLAPHFKRGKKRA